MKFKDRIYDFSSAYIRAITNDGESIEPINEYYNKLDRKKLKSVTVVADGKPLYTLQIKNNKLIYRIRNFAKGLVGNGTVSFADPKRCFILATQGEIAFVWDDGDIEEMTEWKDVEPYTQPVLRDDEL